MNNQRSSLKAVPPATSINYAEEEFCSTTELIERIAQSEGQALLHYFRREVKDMQKAEDLSQDVFLLLIPKVNTIDRRKIRRYAWRIAYNLVCDHFRRARYSTIVLPPRVDGNDAIEMAQIEQGQWEQAFEAATCDNALVGAIYAQLPPEQKSCLLLRFQGELTYSEIAAKMGKTVDQVKGLYHKSLASARQILYELTQGDEE